ncbi:uncharacterized protein UHOD_12103 [Ustilago sp. UG-2017b]|nr:uncharacterized protein UHOD_12103 [Ustilago sp. UG-2017b]
MCRLRGYGCQIGLASIALCVPVWRHYPVKIALLSVAKGLVAVEPVVSVGQKVKKVNVEHALQSLATSANAISSPSQAGTEAQACQGSRYLALPLSTSQVTPPPFLAWVIERTLFELRYGSSQASSLARFERPCIFERIA